MTRDELKAYLAERYPELTPLESGVYTPLYKVAPDRIVAVCGKLRDDARLALDYLANMHGQDTTQQFEVVYNLASVATKVRLDLKLELPYDRAEVETIAGVWPAAGWYEREMWELYGIHVKGHPRLERFLLPDDWNQGYPMRKNWDAPDFVRMPEL